MKLTNRAALAFILAVGTARATTAQDLGIALGTQAPSASVATLDGKATDLLELIRCTPGLIEFWATWCPNCKALERRLRAAAKKYGSQVKFVGVSVTVNQSIDRVKAYVAKHEMPGTQVWDVKGQATDRYDVPAT